MHSRCETGEQGSSPVEFILVGALLSVLTACALQFGFAIYVRNVVHDAAMEGAHIAALSGATLEEGIARTRASISAAVGEGYAVDIAAEVGDHAGAPFVLIRVRAVLPLFGLLGPERGLEVEAHAPQELFAPAG